MEEKDKIVVIKVKEKTRKRLKAMGKKGETYEDVISQIFDELDYPKEYLNRKEEEERVGGERQ